MRKENSRKELSGKFGQTVKRPVPNGFPCDEKNSLLKVDESTKKKIESIESNSRMAKRMSASFIIR